VYVGNECIWTREADPDVSNWGYVDFYVSKEYDGKSYFFRDMNNGTKVIVHLDTNTFHYGASLEDNMEPLDVESTNTLLLSSNMYPWPSLVMFGEETPKTLIYSWGYTN
jgi:hypothetical protein